MFSPAVYSPSMTFSSIQLMADGHRMKRFIFPRSPAADSLRNAHSGVDRYAYSEGCSNTLGFV